MFWSSCSVKTKRQGMQSRLIAHIWLRLLFFLRDHVALLAVIEMQRSMARGSHAPVAGVRCPGATEAPFRSLDMAPSKQEGHPQSNQGGSTDASAPSMQGIPLQEHREPKPAGQGISPASPVKVQYFRSHFGSRLEPCLYLATPCDHLYSAACALWRDGEGGRFREPQEAHESLLRVAAREPCAGRSGCWQRSGTCSVQERP